MTTKHEHLTLLVEESSNASWGDVPIKDIDTVYRELPALLRLVKEQHEALLWVSGNPLCDPAITAYNEWNEEKTNDR